MIHFFGWDDNGLPIRNPATTVRDGERIDCSVPSASATPVRPIPYELVVTLILGIISKARVDRYEASLLVRWCVENAIAPHEWPAGIIAGRVSRCYSNPSLSTDEIEDLILLLDEMAGPSETWNKAPSRIPFASPLPSVVFQRREFVLAGRFVNGRNWFHEDLWQRGASCAETVSRQTDYLVIGALRSQDWALGSVGAAVHQAQALCLKGPIAPAIIGEEYLLHALNACQPVLPTLRIPTYVV